MPKRNNYRRIQESESQMQDQKELMDMMTDLVNFIKSANPVTPEEDVEIQTTIKIKKDSILTHHMFDDFKENGFAIQDDILKLSDWSSNLKEAASAYMSRKNKGI